ncbi:MAG: peptidoglycan DD-metalloendopeptidase family protein, partial [Ignavibacteria bacterium]|nr:peptidoglycan DD-metalloendopeptidase family protein [Ignavibacteria bacterium]
AKWDSVETLKYMVYVVNEIDHVIFDLRDSIKVTEEQKPFTVKEVVASGEIKENLSKDLIALGFDENIGYNTADVFESQIDFTALQPNDKFDILYEQIYVEGKPTMIGKILAAKINHKKKDNFAFLYEKEKAGSYYDANGAGMLGMFLTAPIKFRYRISSKYSQNRYHPVLHRNKAHLGTDFAAAYGTPIQSTAHGVVVEAGYRGGNGNYVKIKHNANYTTQYLHMSRIAKGMRRGAKVSQGQVIGFVGSTGLATGPHVCYRFWKNGKQADPFREKNQATASLSKKYKADFTVVKNTYLQKLESPKS